MLVLLNGLAEPSCTWTSSPSRSHHWAAEFPFPESETCTRACRSFYSINEDRKWTGGTAQWVPLASQGSRVGGQLQTVRLLWATSSLAALFFFRVRVKSGRSGSRRGTEVQPNMFQLG